jgi:hypothetical protein
VLESSVWTAGIAIASRMEDNDRNILESVVATVSSMSTMQLARAMRMLQDIKVVSDQQGAINGSLIEQENVSSSPHEHRHLCSLIWELDQSIFEPESIDYHVEVNGRGLEPELDGATRESEPEPEGAVHESEREPEGAVHDSELASDNVAHETELELDKVAIGSKRKRTFDNSPDKAKLSVSEASIRNHSHACNTGQADS